MPALLLLILIICVIIAIAVFLIVKDREKIAMAQEMYCTECDKTFLSNESFETQVGIYPCPNCAGRATCLNSLESIKNGAFKAEKLYCCDCDKTFMAEQSIKTDVGIYPCPHCAGNNTCLDTLKTKQAKALGQKNS